MASVAPRPLWKDPQGFVYLGHSFGFKPKQQVLVVVK